MIHPDQFEYLVEDLAKLEHSVLTPDEKFSDRNIFAWYRKLDDDDTKVFLLYVDADLAGYISFKEHRKMVQEDVTLALRGRVWV